MMEREGESSAHAAACGYAAEQIVKLIQEVWNDRDGPPTSGFRYRRKQGQDRQAVYFSWTFTGVRNSDDLVPSAAMSFGAASLHAIVSWFPQALTAWAGNCGIYPDNWVLVWRERPDITFCEKTSQWLFYARLTFIPKDAWVLENGFDEAAKEHE